MTLRTEEWLVEAYVRVHGETAEAQRQARARFVTPLLTHLRAVGLGHVSEVADADQPHRPGRPFQAWSLGKLLRLERGVLAFGPPVGTAERRAPAAEPPHPA